jgi:RNA polymerase sigma factor (sigma-70 family)
MAFVRTALGRLMVDSGQRTLTDHGNLKTVLVLLEQLYKELLFLDCTHLIDEVVDVHKNLVSPDDVDDLRQDAQARLLEFIADAVRPPVDFKVTARRAIDSQLRRTRRLESNQRKVIQRLKNLSLTEIEQTPSRVVEQQEISQAVEKAFLNLNQPLAEVLGKLNGLGNFTKCGVNEVADQQQVTRQTIRNWRNQAIQKLKQNSNLKDLAS